MSKTNRQRRRASPKGAAQGRRTRRTNRPVSRSSRKPPARYQWSFLSECRSPRIRRIYGLAGPFVVYALTRVAQGIAETAGDRLWRWGAVLATCVVNLLGLHIRN
ncbi:hypothetical protein [Streptomyces sp. NPDC049040]|uniref:hypothetical protein n=1 Tax=Streptomyces sp. NPDC049040 TaxID=3365593 RepID=UPI00371CD345